MAYSNGTASDFADFFEKLTQFLTAHPDLVAANQQWQLLHSVSVPASGTATEAKGAAFKAPGLAGTDAIFIGMNTQGDSAADWHNLRLYGGTGFDAALITSNDGNLQSGLLDPSPAVRIPLWNSPMPYWFFASGRRVWIVAKVSSNYESGGAGFFLPPCPPSYYPYPLFVSGAHRDEAVGWSTANNHHNGISSPASEQFFARGADGLWTDFTSWAASSSWKSGAQNRLLWPLGLAQATPYSWHQSLRDTFGTFPLLPLTLIALDGSGTWGELDGAYFVPAHNSGAEDIITADGIDHIVFQTAGKSGNPWLFAIRAD